MDQLIITHPLNFYGILIESLSIIFSRKKIFAQITIATIFPLSLLSLCHAHISELLFSNNGKGSLKAAFCLFNAAYVVFFLALSLVSTCGAVEAAAHAYTAKEVRFAEVMGVVPKVWKRVTVTFLWSLAVVVIYNMAAFALLFSLSWGSAVAGAVFGVYVIGFVYMSMVWHLASVVSVLEEDYCGVEAMIESGALLKGRMVISGAVFFVLNLCFVAIQVVYQRFVVVGELVWSRIGCGVVCFLLLSGFTLLGLVAQTVVYFVCKLYHCYEAELGDFDPLRSSDLDHC